MRIWLRLLFAFLFVQLVFGCDQKQDQSDNSSPIKIENLDDKTINKPEKYSYYKRWNDTDDSPAEAIDKAELDNYNNYIEVGENSDNDIVRVSNFKNKRKWLSTNIYYDDDKHLIKKDIILYKGSIIDSKMEEYYTRLGKVSEKRIHKEKNNGTGLYKAQIDFFDNGIKTKTELYLEDGSIAGRSLYVYSDGSKLTSKKIYSTNIFFDITDATDKYLEDKSLSLHSIEYYRSDGKIDKKVYYNQETNKIAHYNKYSYKDKQIITHSYTPEDKLTEMSVYDENNNLVSRKLYD